MRENWKNFPLSNSQSTYGICLSLPCIGHKYCHSIFRYINKIFFPLSARSLENIWYLLVNKNREIFLSDCLFNSKIKWMTFLDIYIGWGKSNASDIKKKLYAQKIYWNNFIFRIFFGDIFDSPHSHIIHEKLIDLYLQFSYHALDRQNSGLNLLWWHEGWNGKF